MVTANQLAAGFLERAGGDPAPAAHTLRRGRLWRHSSQCRRAWRQRRLLRLEALRRRRSSPLQRTPRCRSHPHRRNRRSLRSSRRNARRSEGDLGGVGGSFASELNADGTPRDLEAALSSAVKGNLKGHGSDPNSPTSGAGAFRPWRDSRVLGRASGFRAPSIRVLTRRTSSSCMASGSSAANPMVRFAAVAYWFALHLWLVLSFTMSSHVVVAP